MPLRASCPTNPPSPPAVPGTRTRSASGPSIRRSMATGRATSSSSAAASPGLSAAAHLAKAGANVVLIEAHRFGDGASGRNGGQLGTGQRAWAGGTGGRIRLRPRQGAVRPRRGGQGASARIRRRQQHRDRLSCPASSSVAHKQRYVDEYKAHAEIMASRFGYPHITFMDAPRRRPSGSARRIISAACATPAPATSIR